MPPEELEREEELVLRPLTREVCLDFFASRSAWMKLAWVYMRKLRLPLGESIRKAHTRVKEECLKKFGVWM